MTIRSNTTLLKYDAVSVKTFVRICQSFKRLCIVGVATGDITEVEKSLYCQDHFMRDMALNCRQKKLGCRYDDEYVET